MNSMYTEHFYRMELLLTAPLVQDQHVQAASLRHSSFVPTLYVHLVLMHKDLKISFFQSFETNKTSYFLFRGESWS